VIATNELPRLSDASGALASRMIILNTPESFYGRENHDLTDDLMEELPGIFNWALDGLDRLRGQGGCRYLSRGWLCALRWRRSRLR
jgi:putative DNA primase/helicase